ncbi:MAG: ThiF family adenylyltransferase [Flavobacteriales bacterium]
MDGDEPILYRLSRELDREALNLLLDQHPECQVFDTIESQLKDLIKLENPSFKLTEEEYQEKINEKLKGITAQDYGVWVYYPWKNALVHLLDEEEFIKVRTIRNAYKITFEEQEQLRTKKIGVVGLSVGQSVVMTMALERIAGEFFIADFDRLELSNMNRIRTGVSNLGLLKGSIVKREIAEIDPFIKVHVFNEGITKNNIENFLEGSGKLDLVVEECDNPLIKLLVRKHCKRIGIPVVMELSDRGLLDIERFDLDRDYPILHGLVGEEYLEKGDLSDEDKRSLLFQFMNISEISERGMSSLAQVGITISTWPQLGSDVILGGAVVTMTSRMVLLNQITKSSRTYVDVPSIIN